MIVQYSSTDQLQMLIQRNVTVFHIVISHLSVDENILLETQTSLVLLSAVSNLYPVRVMLVSYIHQQQ